MKYKQVNKINRKISKYIKDNQEHTQPIEAFITFNTEEDHIAALMLGKIGFNIYGKTTQHFT